MTPRTTKRELKLAAGEEVGLEALGGVAREARAFASVYYDTPERRLSTLGLTLRRRTQNGLSMWQLTLPRCGDDLEVEAEGGPADPPPRIRALLAAVLRDRDIEPVATLRTRRSGRRVQGVEVTLDEVEVLDARRLVERFAEIEAELVDGSPESLEIVGRELRDNGATPLPRRTKIGRVLADRKADTRLDGSSVLDLLRAMLGEQYEELLRHDPSVRVGGDPEAVHDMRVAVRRLRSVLRSTRSVLDRAWVDELRDELDWLAQALGEVRDVDVLTAHLEGEVRSLDSGDAVIGARLLELLRARHDTARAQLLAALESERYLALLGAVESAAAAPRTRRVDGRPKRFAAKEFRKLRRRVRELPNEPSAAVLHKIRIRGKRARYAAELVERSEGKPARSFVKAAKALQDVLGEHQDAIVAETTARQLSRQAHDSDAALVAGRLIEREQQRRAEARAAFPRAWAQLERRGRAWLKHRA